MVWGTWSVLFQVYIVTELLCTTMYRLIFLELPKNFFLVAPQVAVVARIHTCSGATAVFGTSFDLLAARRTGRSWDNQGGREKEQGQVEKHDPFLGTKNINKIEADLGKARGWSTKTTLISQQLTHHFLFTALQCCHTQTVKDMTCWIFNISKLSKMHHWFKS